MSPDTKITLIGLGICLLVIALVMYINFRSEHPKRPKSDPQQDYTPYTPPPRTKSVKEPTVKKAAQFDPETVAALYAQADAEMTLALALDEKAAGEKDPVKHAVLSKNAAMHRTRSNQLSFKAFKLESSD